MRYMRRFFLGLLVALVLVSGLLAWALSNPNRFKPELIALIEDQTGLKIRISGELAWRLWPPVQLLAADVSADWNDPDHAPLLHVAELRLDADLLPLLSANPKLKIDGIVIDGLQAKLVQTGDVANWTPPGYADVPPPVPIPPPGSATTPTNWEIGGIALTNSVIDYTVDGDHTRVEIDALRLSGLAPGQAIPLSVRAHISAPPGAPEASAAATLDVELDATLRTDAAFTRWDITDGTLTLADALFTFSLAASELSTVPDVRGRLELLKQPIPALLRVLEIEHDGAVGFGFDFDATLDPQDERVRLSNLSVDVYASQATGSLTYTFGSPQGSLPSVEFALDIDSIVLESEPAATVALGGPGLLGLVAAAAVTPPATQAPDPEPLLPLEALRGIDWRGTLTIAKLVYNGAHFPDTRIETTNRAGLIEAALSMPSFFGGTATSNITIDARRDEPLWRVTPVLSKVDSEPLMTWLDQKLYWAALLLANGEFEMRGNTERELVNSITGRSRFDGGQGTIDITQLKRAVQVIAQLAGGSERIDAWPERLNYQRLTGDWTVDGQKHTLDIALDNMALSMNGTYDPFADVMDMYIDLTIRDEPELNTFQINSMLMGLAIPLRCKGPSTGPTCRADEAGVKNLIADALTGQAGSEATQRLDEVIEEQVPEEYQDAARELLKGFGILLKQTEQQQQQQQQ
ncbi:MAG: AsmA family protein [Gammaproteobacteria bacterium]|nr:MAG: AsmA family protein [Gammaproteobacteria bacterium]